MSRAADMGLLALIALGVAACSTLKRSAPAGWPKLTVREHYVTSEQLRERCGSLVPWYATVEACAFPDLVEKTCDVYFNGDFPVSPYIYDYEVNGRCKGKDNPGSTVLEDYFRRFQEWERANAIR